MKSTDPRIIEIADQYEDKICQEFCEYVDSSKVEDMTTNVFLLSDDECVGEHEDLLYNAGKCVISTGDIFIKSKDIISDRTFVREYIHRISRNRTNDICENFDIIFQEPPTNENDRTIFIQIRSYAECGLN